MAAVVLRNPRIQISRNLNLTLTRFFSSTATLDATPTFRQIKKSIRNESDAEKLVETFNKVIDKPRSHRDRSLFTISVQKLKKMNRPDLVQKILDQQKHDPTNLTKPEGFWIRIIMLYSNARMLDHAIRTFDEIKPELKTVKSFCALLSACLENKKYDLVHSFAASIPSKTGIQPNIVVYNLVMRAFVAEGKDNKAIDLLETKMGDVKPNVASYNVLLTAYLKTGDKYMFRETFEEMKRKGLEPNLVTYNLRISMLCKDEECATAMKLIEEMMANGVKPNENSFNPIIDMFCKTGDFEAAMSVFESLYSHDALAPNVYTYMSLIPPLVNKGEFESALQLCKESIRKKWIPPFASMEGLVKGLVDLSMVDEAKEIVELMKKRLRGNATNRWTEVEAHLPLQ